MESYVPILDFEVFQLGTIDDIENPTDCVKTLAKDIVKALQTVGFVYLKNHGVSESLVKTAFQKSMEFFSLSKSTKKEFSRPTGAINHGWIENEREKLTSERPGDYKEAYDVCPLHAKTWPPIDGFQYSLESLYNCTRPLGNRILDLIALGMDFEDTQYFSIRHDLTKPTHTSLRTTYYPPLNGSEHGIKENQIRCAEHTDYGSLTILYQDEAGGLEVFSQKTNSYVPAPPIKGAVLVNLGDMMQRWTADKLKSTMHRVVNPESASTARQSIACFIHPDVECVVECIDGSNKYPPILDKEYTAKGLDGIYI